MCAVYEGNQQTQSPSQTDGLWRTTTQCDAIYKLGGKSPKKNRKACQACDLGLVCLMRTGNFDATHFVLKNLLFLQCNDCGKKFARFHERDESQHYLGKVTELRLGRDCRNSTWRTTDICRECEGKTRLSKEKELGKAKRRGKKKSRK